MSSSPCADLDSTAQRVARISPARVAIIRGSRLDSSETLLSSLNAIFSHLGIPVLSVSEVQANGIERIEELEYDVLGFLGLPEEFSFFKQTRSREDGPIALAFVPKTRSADSRRFIKMTSAVVLCNSDADYSNISNVLFHFFESLVVPSILNIDLADVRRIAKGIGLAFDLEDNEPSGIIARLPDSSLVARSALLHFSCSQDVRLSEVYSISKAIALKRGSDEDINIERHSDARRLVRKVNVKIGIRIRENEGLLAQDNHMGAKRIRMTAIMFGL